MLKELTNKELIKLNIDASDWVDAVRQAGAPLVKSGKVTKEYVDAMIQNVQEMGPYIVITKHVALPHARPVAGALKTALGIATLKHPIAFGNKDNDPVKYVFCLSAKENTEHLQALAHLAKLLENEKFYEVLDTAKTVDEVWNFLHEEKKGV
ncbi:MAG: PTS sugar transporter subunit IIA [Breznakia sp.]